MTPNFLQRRQALDQLTFGEGGGDTHQLGPVFWVLRSCGTKRFSRIGHTSRTSPLARLLYQCCSVEARHPYRTGMPSGASSAPSSKMISARKLTESLNPTRRGVGKSQLNMGIPQNRGTYADTVSEIWWDLSPGRQKAEYIAPPAEGLEWNGFACKGQGPRFG